eukprot:scaffold417280_cov33-Prasinocladus_malaysianus.AAC.1
MVGWMPPSVRAFVQTPDLSCLLSSSVPCLLARSFLGTPMPLYAPFMEGSNFNLNKIDTRYCISRYRSNFQGAYTKAVATYIDHSGGPGNADVRIMEIIFHAGISVYTIVYYPTTIPEHYVSPQDLAAALERNVDTVLGSDFVNAYGLPEPVQGVMVSMPVPSPPPLPPLPLLPPLPPPPAPTPAPTIVSEAEVTPAPPVNIVNVTDSDLCSAVETATVAFGGSPVDLCGSL